MAILDRLFGSRSGDAYTEGIALFEEGRYAEAAARLRAAGGLEDSSPRGSLAAFYLHKALLGEGRRLLAAGDAARAFVALRDAARACPEFPDLHFLSGTAAGLSGQWSLALTAAREALRQNADYCEARLLESYALQRLGREREAADSLNALIESGRRVSHHLVDTLRREGGYQAADLPHDLESRLRAVAGGDSLKDRLAEAVAVCRAGDWDAGLARLAALAAEHPRFPDIRAKHAAALFQLGRLDEALAEVETALAVNPAYRTAVCLKGLILADRGEVAEARDFLTLAVPRIRGAAGRHEEIFLAYLRATLAFLIGEIAECREMLAGWEDLPRHFARAALLLAACDDLEELPDRCDVRLEELSAVWTADVELAFVTMSHVVSCGHLARAEHLLTRWPGGPAAGDLRPLFLRGRLAVARGRPPEIPEPLPPPATADQPRAAAWRQLAAHRALLTGKPATARDLCLALMTEGTADEETGRLWLQAAAVAGGDPQADPPAQLVPDSWVPPLCWLRRRQGRGREAEQILADRRAVRPDRVRWWWLGMEFWLGPVRRWIS